MSDESEKRFAEIEALADQYAAAQAQSDYLDDFTKSLMSQLMKTAEASGAKSAAIQERDARADGVFLTHLMGKQVATERALALKWKLTIWQARFEWARTKAANRRAEMNLR